MDNSNIRVATKMLIGIEIDGVLLKRDRVALGYSQKVVRDLLEDRFGVVVSDRYPMRWERGANVGDSVRFKALCELLGHPPERYRPLREKLRAAGLGPEPPATALDEETADGMQRIIEAIVGSPGEAGAQLPVCILGGGAHQVAAHVVAREEVTRGVDAVAWLHCTPSEVELMELQLALAETMEIGDGLVEVASVSRATFRAAFLDRLWSDERRLLLVLDGVTSASVLTGFLRPGGGSRILVLTASEQVASDFEGSVVRADAPPMTHSGLVASNRTTTRIASALVVLGERRFTAAWAAGLAGVPLPVCETVLSELVQRSIILLSTPAEGGLPQLYRWVPSSLSAGFASAVEVAAARRRLPLVALGEATRLNAMPPAERDAMYARARSLWLHVLEVLVDEVLANLGSPHLGNAPNSLDPWLELGRVVLSESEAARALPRVLVALSPWLGRPYHRGARRWHLAGYVAAVALEGSNATAGRLAARVAADQLPDFPRAIPWLEVASTALRAAGDHVALAAVNDRLAEALASCGNIEGSVAAAREGLELTGDDTYPERAIRVNNAALMSLVSGQADWHVCLDELGEALDACSGNDLPTRHVRAAMRWNMAVLAWTHEGHEHPELPLAHGENALLVGDAVTLASTLCAADQLPRTDLRQRIETLARARAGGEGHAAWMLGALAFHGLHHLRYERELRAAGKPPAVPLLHGRIAMYASPPPTAPELRLGFLYDVRGAVSVMDEALLGEMHRLASAIAGRDDAAVGFIEAIRAALRVDS